MRVAIFPLIAATAFIAAVPAYAHHSFAATYDEGKSITVDGKVVEFLYRNPHCLFSVEATDDRGKRPSGKRNGSAPGGWAGTASRRRRSSPAIV